MDLSQLALFVDVARKGSFAGVARDRGVEPSSVARSIAALEASLGTRLLQRTTRSMALTGAGSLYLARAPALLEAFAQLREATGASNAQPEGNVRLTASTAFGTVRLVPLLGELRASLPRIRLELLLTDATLDLVADGIDLAIRLGPARRADPGAERLFPTRYRVVAGLGWADAAGSLTCPADLAAHRCLLQSLPAFRRSWIFRDADGTREEVPVAGDILIANALALRDAARAGLGPALLADWLIDADLADGRLVDLFPSHRVTATTFDTAAWIFVPSRDFVPRPVRSVLTFLRARLSTPTAARPCVPVRPTASAPTRRAAKR